MKCPKCHYISFDSPERCRHCGYEFAMLADDPRPVDAPLRNPSAVDGPLPELSLHDDGAWQAGRTPTRADGAVDLPLFDEPVPGLDDTPLISSPSPPRPPLSVRRATPDPSRLPRPGRAREQRPEPPSRPAPPAASRPAHRPDPAPSLLDEAQVAGIPPVIPISPAGGGRASRHEAAGALGADAELAATAGARLVALGVDVALLAAINLAVVHFTLAVVGYPWSRIVQLPLLPLVAFCLMLDAGYFILLTGAAGQTLGKMLAGIRVVGTGARVSVTQAALRASLAPLSLATLGLGYLPALIGPDRRALHDRLSHTRVVRAGHS